MKVKILLAAVGLSATLVAQAAQRTIEFQAIVSGQTGNFGPGAGETFTGRFTYDTEAGQLPTGAIRYPLQSFELDLGSVGTAIIDRPRYTPMGDEVWLDGRGLQLAGVTYESGRLQIILGHDAPEFLLPDEPEDLLNWRLPGIGYLSDGTGASGIGSDNRFGFEVTSVSMVPEASGWAMSALGLASIAVLTAARGRRQVHSAPSTTI